MQIIFESMETASCFAEKNSLLFPDAPQKCQQADCQMPIAMKKHGYYRRYIITDEYSGYIYLRRYICPCCGRTVSFLPSFAIPYFQYSIDYILGFVDGFFKFQKSLRQYVLWFQQKNDTFSCRHFRYYIDRLFKNKKRIQYFFNLTGQGMIPEKNALNRQMFAKAFLTKALKLQPHNFSYRFQNQIGKSILAPN